MRLHGFIASNFLECKTALIKMKQPDRSLNNQVLHNLLKRIKDQNSARRKLIEALDT